MRVLLDTNVVSELRKGRRCHEAVAAWQSKIDPHALFPGVVTLLELRLGIALKARKDKADGRWVVGGDHHAHFRAETEGNSPN